MSRISLSAFAAKHGQQEAAEKLGVTQGALSKAIRVGRTVYITVLPDGSCTAKEVRPFPFKKTAA